MTSLVGGAWQDRDDAAVVEVGRTLLADLVKHDDWLPELMAEGPPHGYAQNLLWCDPFERFSVVSFVWAPSACTPVHDHQRGAWSYAARLGVLAAFRARSGERRAGERRATILAPGDVEVLLPAEGTSTR